MALMNLLALLTFIVIVASAEVLAERPHNLKDLRTRSARTWGFGAPGVVSECLPRNSCWGKCHPTCFNHQ
eukprot:5207102-Amphidinium_carterae.1